MNTVTKGVTISPVNMEDRKALGIRAGDTVRVHQKIQDKGKTRIQVFEGVVLARKHGNEPGATFTVRKVASGVGVEKIFPLYSPNIDKIEIVKRAKVRRAKLYFIREKVAREIKRQMRRMRLVALATESEAEAKVRAEEEAKAAEEAAKKAEEEASAAQTEETAEVSSTEEVSRDSGEEAAQPEETPASATAEETEANNEEKEDEATKQVEAEEETVSKQNTEEDSTEENKKD